MARAEVARRAVVNNDVVNIVKERLRKGTEVCSLPRIRTLCDAEAVIIYLPQGQLACIEVKSTKNVRPNLDRGVVEANGYIPGKCPDAY